MMTGRSPRVLTRRGLNRATLARQLLLERERIGAVDAVERLVGLQAQEPRPPYLGLWTRLAEFRRKDLHAALHDRAVVRATLMRATLHLMSAADYAVFRTTLAPSMAAAVRVLGARAKGLDLTALLPVARDLLAEQPRDFAAIRELLAARFPGVDERALGYAVRTHLPLTMVPTADPWGFARVTEFTLAETWLGRALSDQDAVDDLVLRYLAAFGPASAADAQTWSGLPALRDVLQRLRDRLVVFRDERGRDLFDLPEAPRPDDGIGAPVRFLPEFDNLVLSHADRTRVIADAHRGQVVTKNLRVRATFLWDGFVAGTWTIQRSRARATLRLAPFEPLPTRAAAALAEEGEALLHFAEPDATTFDVRQDPSPPAP